MKSVEQIVQKREQLRIDSKEHMEKLNILKARKWSTLSDEEKREYNELWHTVRMLEVQIDTLTYVINYDSELRSVILPRKMISGRG